MTQKCLSGLPDLNTAHDDVQDYVLSFLKECVDIGVDGFRFDMAKSIETPRDDNSFASEFWPVVVGGAEDYAQDTQGKDLYIYGEVLDNPVIAISAYTEYMAVTDNTWGNSLRGAVAGGSATMQAGYHKAAGASNLVIWAESHDTFADGGSSGVSEANINKTWALVAARADAMGLYLARPENLKQALGVASVTGWDNPEVEAANEFHNAFNGKSETVGNSGSISYVVRGDNGIVLVNTKGNAVSVAIEVEMADGTYTDQITGTAFTVADGKITGQIGETGIAVVYNVEEDPDPKPEDPTDPTTEPTTAPTTNPTNPTTKPTNPTTKPTDPTTKPTDPTEPTTDPTDPTTDPDDPTNPMEPTDPVTDGEVTVKDAADGDVSVSTKNPKPGDKVTITVTPDEGSAVDKVVVLDKNGKEVSVTANSDGTYSFIQPEGEVTVEVTFKGAYKIIKGNNTKWQKGSKNGITLTVNGDFTKFLGVEVNNKKLDAKHYEAKAGSTVITLKKSYLDSLTAGTYDITVFYTNGETSGTFVVEKAPTGDNPGTGDSSNLLLWCTVWLLCMVALCVLILAKKKKFFVK